MKRFKYAKIGDEVAYKIGNELCISKIISIGTFDYYNYPIEVNTYSNIKKSNDLFKLSGEQFCKTSNKLYYYRNNKCYKHLPILTLIKRILHLDKSNSINIKLKLEYENVPKIRIDKSINIKIK